jgi:hypothetical protein
MGWPGPSLLFAFFFHEKWNFIEQREMQRKKILFWRGPASALQPRKLSRNERKFCENFAKILRKFREN